MDLLVYRIVSARLYLFELMPTYTYKYENGETIELVQKMSDMTYKVCPKTGRPIKRIISGGSGFQLKGTGWYQSDYKKRT